MNVRLLRGFFISLDGHAISDFEQLQVGPVSDLTPGVDETGGCSWGDTAFVQR